ncbi:cache domain-containing sensor histidine kinase [Pseudalkalibacillus decolorationis]|uniref:cache domain-containing sensor histidine kinase n=1 Tax=Pseudalkalibacillus decolorationis TaxID=163879 RepID=UPI002147654F|nr:histidine kinase [Pseudalkalibacillus decolorationis]
MKQWFRRSLQNQLTVFILLAVLLPICLLGVFSYLTAVHLSKERATISGKSALQQLETQLEIIVNDVENMSVFLIGNEDVQQYLQMDQDPYQQRRAIYGFLSNLALSKPYISNVVIEPINGNPDISIVPTLTSNRESSDFHKAGKWWSSHHEDKTTLGTQEMITLSRPIRSTDGYDLIGYLSISLDQQVIEEHLESINFEWNGFVLLMYEGDVLAGQSEKFGGAHELASIYSIVDRGTSKHAFTYQMDGEKSTVLSTTLSDVGWKLVGIIPFQEYSAQNRYFLWLTVIAVAIAGLLVSGLVLFFVRKVIGPLSSLTTAIRTSHPGDGIEQVVLHSQDEVGQLIVSYNNLNDRIRLLMERVKKNEAIKRKVDLQALQAQINPHFLYNTLASVHWMALSARETNISEMVSSLSGFLRFSLNKGNEYCTVEQELAHLSHYVSIQEIRYPGAFHLKVHIPGDVKQMYMLKLVLQPLIENSIVHGLFPKSVKNGVIKVNGEWDQTYLHMTVTDNGVGMTEEMVQQLHHQFAHDASDEIVVGKSYGLRNVNLRLLLHYGPSARLSITSHLDHGTSVQFSIPLERR